MGDPCERRIAGSQLPRRPGQQASGDMADRRVAGEGPEPGCEGRAGHGAQTGELTQAPGVLGLVGVQNPAQQSCHGVDALETKEGEHERY